MAKGKKSGATPKRGRPSSKSMKGRDKHSKVIAPDQKERDAIVSRLEVTMLVEASAGAGKTRSMVDRMIALLREGKCQIETLAAITFTRKAAAELRGRFQVALETAAREAKGKDKERLAEALSHAERVFIGTIHSFCGRLLRERPVEAGIEPSFQELDEATDARLCREAWTQYVANLIATGDSILGELQELGLQVVDLVDAFGTYATYPDVDEWPATDVELPDLGPVQVELRDYVAHMETLIPTFPDDQGNDKLMPKYERIVRMARQADLGRAAELMEIIGEFRLFTRRDLVQRNWPEGGRQAIAELDRWNDFTVKTAQPLGESWLQKRYAVVLRALDGAVSVYDQLRRDAGGLNYQDLLLQAAALLRDKPPIRRYFRRRFTHLLVDEFQDTDPVQAEVMLLLTGDDPSETDWRRCRPVPGALFVVGDPKQSIYRFRRADIVTYNEVKRVIAANGEVVVLTTNFRSQKPVIDWVNGTFDQIFPLAADAYSPERSPMAAALGIDGPELLGGVQVLNIPGVCGKNEEAVQYEAEAIARTIYVAVSGSDGTASAKPGDFLIISARKRNLSIYARELTERGIPCEVTGGAVLNEVRELALLSLCLDAVTQPDDPVALVAALRGELFGLSDEALYAFKRAGGRFSFHAPLPETLEPRFVQALEEAFGRLRRYDLWLKRVPPVAAIERIAADLGLSACAAAGPGGNVRAGSVARAIELTRAAQSTAASISEIVEYLRQLVAAEEKQDGLSAAAPREAPVRIMNLHHTKGLEADVVFLADPTGKSSHEPQLHVDRSGDRVRGYLLISRAVSEWSRQVLARPADWDKHAAEEQQFQDAEQNRLLYVAATRVATKLVVARREKGDRWNPWNPLGKFLTGCPELSIPEPQETADHAEREIAADEPNRAAARICETWETARKPTFAAVAAKAISVTRTRPMPTAGEHGTEWGTVIHLLLETVMRDVRVNLDGLARACLAEQGLDPTLAQKAVEAVRAVMGSDIWRRAQASPRRLVEVPFQTLLPTHPETGDAVPTVLRGVIDLVFREDAGWVVVDYKTDVRSRKEIPQLVEHYRGQVETYAGVWQETIREPVVERGLYFTHPGIYLEV